MLVYVVVRAGALYAEEDVVKQDHGAFEETATTELYPIVLFVGRPQWYDPREMLLAWLASHAFQLEKWKCDTYLSERGGCGREEVCV